MLKINPISDFVMAVHNNTVNCIYVIVFEWMKYWKYTSVVIHSSLIVSNL